MKKLLFVLMTLESLTAIPAMAGTCSVYVDENFYIANDFLVKKNPTHIILKNYFIPRDIY
jgi:hypothetical protein